MGKTAAIGPDGADGLSEVEGEEWATLQGVVSPHVETEKQYKPDILVPGLLKLYHSVNKVLNHAVTATKASTKG